MKSFRNFLKGGKRKEGQTTPKSSRTPKKNRKPGQKATVPSKAAAETPSHKVPDDFDEKSMRACYQHFGEIITAVEADPVLGGKLISAIIDNENLFNAYMARDDFIQSLVKLAPTRRSDIIDNFFKCPQSRKLYLQFLHKLTWLAKVVFKAEGDEIMTRVLADKAIYDKWLNTNRLVQRVIDTFPNVTNRVLDILLNDVERLKACCHHSGAFVSTSRFNPEYTDRFVELLLSNDDLFDHVVTCGALPNMMREYPTFQARLFQKALETPERVRLHFGSLIGNYEMSEEWPEHEDTIFQTSLTIPNFVEKNISDIDDLIYVHERNPQHAQEFESRVLQNPDHVIKMVGLQSDFQILCEHEAFSRLKAAYLSDVFSRPDRVKLLLSRQEHLDNMIAKVPELKEKLTFYFQLWVEEKPLDELVENYHQLPDAMTGLKVHIEAQCKAGKFDRSQFQPLAEKVGEFIDETPEGSDQRKALESLQTYLKLNIASKQQEFGIKAEPIPVPGTQKPTTDETVSPPTQVRSNSN